MKKLLLFNAFVVLFSLISFGQQSNYTNFDNSWYFTTFLTQNVSGGGSVTLKIENNILTLRFSAGFVSTPMKTGVVVNTGTLDVLPNLYFGVINYTSYHVRIQNNFIDIFSEQPIAIDNFNNTIFTVDLLNPDSWTLDPDNSTPDNSIILPNVSDNQNYIYKIQPQVPVSSLDGVIAIKAIHSVTYIDEIGRVKQNTGIAQSPAGKDLIHHTEYDNFGRQAKEYLLSPSDSQSDGSYIEENDLINQTKSYFQNNFNDDNIFSEKLFENSPLNRVLKQGSTGNDWLLDAQNDNDHTGKFNYQTNSVNEVVRYKVSYLNNNIEDPQLIYENFYSQNTLNKIITKDENWKPSDGKNHTTEEFKDNFGRVLLTRTYADMQVNGSGSTQVPHDNYYVYDDYGNLTFVLPPKFENSFIGTNLGITDRNRISFDWRNFMNSPIGGGGSSNYIEVVNGKLIVVFSAGFTTQPLKIDGVVKSLGWTDIPDLTIGNFASGHYTAFMRSGNLYIEGDGTSLGGLSLNVEIDLNQPSSSGESIIYQYKYDKRKRLIEKKIPGKDKEYVIYNKLDQPILTQDGNLRLQNKWLFTKYDVFGRVVYTGIYQDGNSRQGMQDMAYEETEIIFENRLQSPTSIDGVISYYSNNTFPFENGALEIYTINYYTDYIDIDGGVRPSTVYGVSTALQTKNLPTVSKIRVLGTNSWITSVTYYDNKTRPIYVYSKNNYLNTIDIVENKLDFRGKVVETKTTHKKTGKSDIVTIDKFTYDNAERLSTHTNKINTQAEQSITVNEYDELGNLIRKKVGGTTTSELQEVDYKYNIRGWLTQINDVNNINDDLFSLRISYNNIEDDIYNQVKPLYNSNISETYWKTANDNYLRGYGYSYDALNRFKDAWFEEPNNLEFLNTNNRIKKYPGFYDTRLITYDKNGNIDYLRRSGKSESNAAVVMDRLYFSYEDNSNKLLSVSQGNDATQEGFTDGNTSGDDYAYDFNGNLNKDLNKGIGTATTNGIIYNHMNLPTEVIFNNSTTKRINYIYDATGIKLKKVVNDNGNITTTDYAGNYVYENGNLHFFNHPEGYVTPNGNSYNYIYQYKDHWGNIRLSYSDNDGDGHITDAAVFSDGFENISGWNSAGALYGSSITTYDSNFKHSGNYSGKIVKTTSGEIYVHSNEWININNDIPTQYTFSGWIYTDNSSVDLFLFMNKENETAYFTNIQSIRTYTKNKWVYLEKTVTVPANIRKLNIRIDHNGNYGGGIVWFDDIRVKRAGPSEIVEESNYYPFGLKHKGYNTITSSIGNSIGQKYKTFQGQEFTDNLGLNIHEWKYRFSDPSIGRFWQIDPLAQDYTYNSTYAFQENKLGLGIELEGLEVQTWDPFDPNLSSEQAEQAMFAQLSIEQHAIFSSFGSFIDNFSWRSFFGLSKDIKNSNSDNSSFTTTAETNFKAVIGTNFENMFSNYSVDSKTGLVTYHSDPFVAEFTKSTSSSTTVKLMTKVSPVADLTLTGKTKIDFNSGLTTFKGRATLGINDSGLFLEGTRDLINGTTNLDTGVRAAAKTPKVFGYSLNISTGLFFNLFSDEK